jgi:hypothetical protein
MAKIACMGMNDIEPKGKLYVNTKEERDRDRERERAGERSVS